MTTERERPNDQECDAETWSWWHFNDNQLDPYWIRCTELGPHDQHEDANTGLVWEKTPEERVEQAAQGASTNPARPCPILTGHGPHGDCLGAPDTGPASNLERAHLVTVRPGDRVIIVFPPDVDLDLEDACATLRERFPDDVVTLVIGASHIVHHPAETQETPR